ncbi:MAG: hypothetical protein KA214_03475 [Neisseriaceae bacterium]|nr:hypothetical protein [Neisseriaceae bacterium]
MKTRGKTLAPRNPYAVLAKQRVAGAHEKTHKAKRKQAKRQLQLTLSQADKRGEFFNSPLFFGA